MNEAQAELGIAEADFKRAESLNAEEIIPRKDYLRAKADRDKAAASLRAAADRLRLLGGSPSASGAAVSAFAVTAPFAGTVIEKKATLGELASPSEPLFSVADLSRVWIQADLPESALAKVRIGANAKVTVPAYPNEVFAGRVGHIGASLDKDTRTVAGAHRGGQCRWPAEARDVRHRHHRSGRRQARGHLAARRGHRADGRQADGLRLQARRVRSARRSNPANASAGARC